MTALFQSCRRRACSLLPGKRCYHLPWYCGALHPIIFHCLKTKEKDKLKSYPRPWLIFFFSFLSLALLSSLQVIQGWLFSPYLPLARCYLQSKGFRTPPLCLGAAGKAGRGHGAGAHCHSFRQGGAGALLPILRAGTENQRRQLLSVRMVMVLSGVKHLPLCGQQAEEEWDGEAAAGCTSQLINTM